MNIGIMTILRIRWASPSAAIFGYGSMKRSGRNPKVKVAYTPVLCMHCENPSCVLAVENNAVRRQTGNSQ
jgi:Fe-S-cluster-containing dehydrogenase component